MRPSRVAVVVLALLLLAEGAYFVGYGRFNIDEGMHRNAGHLIFESGELPYRDFPFSQGPAGPFFYGAAEALFGDSLAVGRGVSWLANAAVIGLWAAWVGRLVGASGVVVLLALLAVNLPAQWAFTQIRTEAPSIALVGAAVVALSMPRERLWHWALAPTLLVWSTAFRLTNAALLVAVCALVAFELRREPRRLAGVAAIVLANGLLAAAPMLAFLQESWFHVVSSQLDRAERLGWDHFGFGARFWFFGQPETGFRSILLLAAIPGVWLVRSWRDGWRPSSRGAPDPRRVVGLALALALLSWLPLLVFRVGFFQYFVNASLLLTLAIAVALPAAARALAGRGRALYALAALACVASAWVGLQHLEVWVDPERPTVGRLAGVRESLRALAPDDCTMLTFQTHLAAELGCRVTPGLEYSYFSFFRDRATEAVEPFGVLNQTLLAGALRRDRPELIALTWPDVKRITGRSKDGDTPPRLRGMRGRYRLVETLELPVGPIHTFRTKVYVYARRDLRGRAEPETSG